MEPLKEALPLRKRVYERLEDLIIYGLLAPGEHLVESDLADTLGVSRIPVREALQLLNSNGWVELRPRFGAFVRQPTLQEVDDVFGVRTLLEVESARLAALEADDEAVSGLRAMLRAGDAAVARRDEEELVRLNSSFHGFITTIAGNRVLAEMIDRLDKRIRWYFRSVASARGRASWQEHADLVDAIEGRDPDRAAQTMRLHAELTRSAYHEART